MFTGEDIVGDNITRRERQSTANYGRINFVEQKVIQEAVFAPLLKVADYLDCLFSDLSSVVATRSGFIRTAKQSCVKSYCIRFLASAALFLPI